MIEAPRDGEKRAAAEAAVAEIEAGMLVGLGTGTTAAFAIAALGERARAGLRIKCVATSFATARAAEAVGLAILDMADQASVDLCIDGVDEIDPDLRAIKGGGGAMVREKIVAAAASRMIAIADSSKAVTRLGSRAVPIEVLEFGWRFVAAEVGRLGAIVTARQSGSTFYRSDQGNPVLDCSFAELGDPAALSAVLDALPGMVGHGLFIGEIDALYLGTAAGVRKSGRTPSVGDI
ncbi:ribose-5-phosphate isomerase RpiA [Sphingomonas bacterium]|uniref:ribose-5-phosphate isomerase RpiA n=1 Tax=Sphingomonas bacterium TaxID=1895847 RepID=UPI0015750D3F|nr:ribose-5-phosphate isomerase RpiA [Sphingomonas bacterium]